MSLIISNETRHEIQQYPAGEWRVTCPEPTTIKNDWFDKYVFIHDNTDINNHLIQSFLLGDILKQRYQNVSLVLPYLPYAREDVRHPRTSLSLKVLADLINSQNFYRVITWDVHSPLAAVYINNLVEIPIYDIIHNHHVLPYDFSNDKPKTCLVIPDQGAYKRLNKVVELFDDKIVCIKNRNPENGHIQFDYIVGDVHNKDCVIVDDICDGGMTFKLIAKELKKRGAHRITLYVTHGIFSKGLDTIYESGVDRIVTTNTLFINENRRFEYGDKFTVKDVKGMIQYANFRKSASPH